MTNPDHQELVAAVLAVDGVADAVVEQDVRAQGPGSLRLRLVEGADEAVVAHEVSRLLHANLHLGVDADRMEIIGQPRQPPMPTPTPIRPPPLLPRHAAELPPDAPDAVERLVRFPSSAKAVAEDAPRQHVVPSRPGRLAIERVQTISTRVGIVVTVGLALGDQVFTGEMEGPATTGGKRRTAAAATLRAIENAIQGRARFEPDFIEVARGGSDETAVAVITMITERGSERLAGAAPVEGDVAEAVIRSVLSAVNRRLKPLLSQP